MNTATISLSEYDHLTSENKKLKQRVKELEEQKVTTYRCESFHGLDDFFKTKDEAINDLVGVISEYKEEIKAYETDKKNYYNLKLELGRMHRILDDIKEMSLIEFFKHKRRLKTK